MSDAADVLSANGGTEDLGFDPDALRAKYREERDKRIRVDGNEQYIEVTGDFSRYVDDPYVDPGFTREPRNETLEIVIVGGGFGGLLAGARLREAGVQDLRIVEKGGDFGGTWYWNRYPGAQCDIESYIYLPCSRRLDTCRKRSIPSHRKSSRTHAASGRSTICIAALSFRPWSRKSDGARKSAGGWSAPIVMTCCAHATS